MHSHLRAEVGSLLDSVLAGNTGLADIHAYREAIRSEEVIAEIAAGGDGYRVRW